jgi:hypothetical protein
VDLVESALSSIRDARGDAVTTAALAVVRRALVEGVPLTREGWAQEVSFALGGPPRTRCDRSTTSPSASACRR